MRAGVITFLLLLAFVGGWPARIPKMVRAWPASAAAVALKIPELKQKLLAPFSPAADLLGITTEDWALFTGTGGTRYRIWLEGRGARGGFKLLYRAHDPAHTYRAGTLEYRRVFNLWNPHHDWISGAYPDFTRALARQMFHDDRRLQVVRVRMEEVAIEPRGAGFTPTGRFAYEAVVERAEVPP